MVVENMKQRQFIILAIVIFWARTLAMEKSPRLSPELPSDHHEILTIKSLIHTIEAETEYPNPHAPARIKNASKQLFALTHKSAILFEWNQSTALQRSHLLYCNAIKTTHAHQTDNLAECAKLLLSHAHQIFLAMNELDKKIQNLNSVLPCDS